MTKLYVKTDWVCPQCAPDFEILPLKFWIVTSKCSYSKLEKLKNLLFEQGIKKWSHTVNVRYKLYNVVGTYSDKGLDLWFEKEGSCGASCFLIMSNWRLVVRVIWWKLTFLSIVDFFAVWKNEEKHKLAFS